MRTAGMFYELGKLRPPTPQESIVTNVTEAPLADAGRVVSYLAAGHVLIDMMDLENDYFDHTRQVMNGSSVLTDGDFLWRKDYACYVGRHNVKVPDDFLRLIRDRHYIVPDLPESILDDCADKAEWGMFC